MLDCDKSPHKGNVGRAIAGKPCPFCHQNLPLTAKLTSSAKLDPPRGGHSETCSLRFVAVEGQRITD